ncbi:MAG: DsbA family protein [Pseudomonadota bacterium]
MMQFRGLGLALAGALLLSLSAPAAAQDAASDFSPSEEQAIRDLVRDYLVEHPEVLVEALQVYQERQRAEAAERQREAVAAQKELLSEDTRSPAIGNLEGDVVIVEFFDYKCGYCRSVAEQVRASVKDDGNIRLVMKEFPILSAESRLAARAALAAAKQDRYEDYHFELMKVPGSLNKANLLKVAESIGMDPDQLEQDMQDPEIDAELRRTYDLARALQINGTPAFVIGDQVIPGAVDMQTLRNMVAEQRAKSS